VYTPIFKRIDNGTQFNMLRVPKSRSAIEYPGSVNGDVPTQTFAIFCCESIISDVAIGGRNISCSVFFQIVFVIKHRISDSFDVQSGNNWKQP
jgi:hypothetical protein